MADRGPVKIREGNIEDLIKIYKVAYLDVVADIEKATTAGKIRKFSVMNAINHRLEELEVDVTKWVEDEMPQYYRDGANQAAQDLKALGVDTSKRASMSVIQTEAVKALIDETALAFAESMRGISRSASRLLSDTLKQQLNFIIAEGRLTGDTRKMISARVEQRLRDEGLTVLIDKGGHKWEFDQYSRMLVRTKAVEARNQGLANRMLQSGYDLVQVSSHGSKHQACRKWEGLILSISGNTSTGTELEGGMVVSGTVEQARSEGLFHPNCKHSINVIVPSLASQTKAYDNPYNYLNKEEREAADKAFRERNLAKNRKD